MSSPSPDNKNPEQDRCVASMVHFGQRQVHKQLFYLFIICTASVLLILFRTLDNVYHLPSHVPETIVQDRIKPVTVSEKKGKTAGLINKLRQYGLWEIAPLQEVARFFIESYPADLHTVGDMSIRKRVFLHALLPHALLVRQEVLQKRGRLEVILSRIECPLEEINFASGSYSESKCSWIDYLQDDEILFIKDLSKNYRTTSAEVLLERVDAVPISIILAQGALESSWGGSRFTREGNSIFGMWTWKTKGMVPSRREAGKTHKVKTYADVLGAVRAYQLTLNRLDSYERFRQLRKHTDNPLIMVEGLTLYSARGEAYVEDIKNVIRSNDLQKYESCSLSDPDQSEPSGHVLKYPDIAQSDNKNTL